MNQYTSHADDLKKVGELIKDVNVAMLTTTAEDGSLRSRPMATQKEKDETFTGSLWFFTSDDSGKISEIYHNRHVGLSYANPSKNIYVSLSGIATVVHDRAKAAELWSPLLKAWFPGGLDDPSLALLHVNVTYAEYWHVASGKMVILFKEAKAAITGEPPKIGEHNKLTV